MFISTRSILATSLLAVALAACSDGTDPQSELEQVAALSAAFNAVPAGFSNTESSFQGGTPDGFCGPNAGLIAGGRGGRGFGAGLGFGGLMGGGILHGLDGFFGRGRPGANDLANCTLDATGRVTCPAQTRNGLTIERSFAFTTAGGEAQATPDSTTNSINAQIEVSGTVTHRNGATSTVSHESDRTVTGLAAGSAQRTVNARSQGAELTVFETDSGTLTTEHRATDVVNNVVVPVAQGSASYPISGTVERSMTVTITLEGGSPQTSSRREVITYNGTSTATLVITRNGETKTCTLPLPRGRPSCQ